MWILFILVVVLIFWAYKPSVEYIEESKIVICHYNKGVGRDYFILFRL